MREPDLAARLIDAAVGATSRPVTLKMRLGWDDQSRNAPQIAARAESLGVRAITVHGRTRKQFYSGTADWRAVALVKQAVSVPVVVNGDIVDADSARAALEQSGADAVMIGRGAYGRPWIAAALDRALAHGGQAVEPCRSERLAIALEHFTESLRFYGDAWGLKIFRKHLGWYVERAAWPADPARRRMLRAQICQIDNPRDVERALAALWTKSALSIPAPLPI
jgi:nifR3 family TIM-barrel protein